MAVYLPAIKTAGVLSTAFSFLGKIRTSPSSNSRKETCNTTDTHTSIHTNTPLHTYTHTHTQTTKLITKSANSRNT